jgi:hypothetical protein
MPSARTVSARIWSVSACVVNRTKSCLARLGTQNFKSTLGKAWERLETLRTPEGGLVPPNTLAELRRDLARLRLIMDQVKEINESNSRLTQEPMRWYGCWPARPRRFQAHPLFVGDSAALCTPVEEPRSADSDPLPQGRLHRRLRGGAGRTTWHPPPWTVHESGE